MPISASNSRTHVVAGVIRDDEGRVLLAQRPAGKPLAGMWEFPGGKVDAGEDPELALIRELDEELGIRARIGRRLIAVPHGRIVLDVREVAAFEGLPYSRERQALTWIAPRDIDLDLLPAADRPVVAALNLPDCYLITPEPDTDHPEGFLACLERVLLQGVRLIQLRLPGWSRERVAPLAKQVRQRCVAHGAQLVLHADWMLAEVLGLDGVHLPARVAASLSRRPLPRGRWVGVSCHDAAELAHAARIGADFATLSPVSPTMSHPDAIPLGWERASELIADAELAVYALGGQECSDIAEAHAHGAQGIAAIRAVWPV